MTDRHALPRAAGSIRLIGVKKNHRLSRWVAFFIEYFHSLFHGDEYFVFVDYEHIIGFTEGWRELQAMNGHGGIYVIPLDLAQVGYKDKMAMIEAIHKHSDT